MNNAAELIECGGGEGDTVWRCGNARPPNFGSDPIGCSLLLFFAELRRSFPFLFERRLQRVLTCPDTFPRDLSRKQSLTAG